MSSKNFDIVRTNKLKFNRFQVKTLDVSGIINVSGEIIVNNNITTNNLDVSTIIINGQNIQTIISNANTSTTSKLLTARTLTIGNSEKLFDGSSDVSWNLIEIGAASITDLSNLETQINNNIQPSLNSKVDLSGNQTINGIKTFTSNISGNITGNANTATTLQNTRTLTIGNTGKTFNGSSDVSWNLIEIGAASITDLSNLETQINNNIQPSLNSKVDLNGNQTINGIKTFTFNISGNITGNANTATILQTSKSIWGQSFNGSANISGNLSNVGNITLGVQSGKATLSYNSTSSRTYTIPDTGGDADFVLTSGTQTIGGSKTFSSTIIGSINGNANTATTLQTSRSIWGQSFNGSANITGNLSNVGNITLGVQSGKATLSYNSTSSRTYTIPDGGGNADFVLTSGTQTIGGSKTFSSTIIGSINGNANTATTLQTSRSIWGQSFNGSANITGNLSNVGNITLGTQSNKATLTYTTNTTRTYTIPDGSGDADFVLTNGTQTIGGSKTFSNTIIGNINTATTLQTGRTLTIGNSGKTFNGSSDVSWNLAEIGAASLTDLSNLQTQINNNQGLVELENIIYGTDENTGIKSLLEYVYDYVISNDNKIQSVDNLSTIVYGTSTVKGIKPLLEYLYDYVISNDNNIKSIGDINTIIYGSNEVSGIKEFVNTTNDYILNGWNVDNSKIYYNLGNVGIGTTEPTSKLTVLNGDADADCSFSLGHLATRKWDFVSKAYDATFNGYELRIQPDVGGFNSKLSLMPVGGNVGIGTIEPDKKLDVRGDIVVGSGVGTNRSELIFREVGTELANSRMTIWLDASQNSVYRNTGSTTKTIFYNNRGDYEFTLFNGTAQYTPFMIKGTDGSVGIGTTSPRAILDVVGTLHLNEVYHTTLIFTSNNNQQIDIPITSQYASYTQYMIEVKYVGIASNGSANSNLDNVYVLREYDININLPIVRSQYSGCSMYASYVHSNIATGTLRFNLVPGSGFNSTTSGRVWITIRKNRGEGVIGTATITDLGSREGVSANNIDGGISIISGNVGIGTTNPGSYKLFVNGSAGGTSAYVNTSDDRIKFNETYINDATQTLMKLRPQIYHKSEVMNEPSGGFIESGLIAQEVYYDTPELRHLVNVPEDASGIETPPEGYGNHNAPQLDSDYSNWGSTSAGLNYTGLIPYLIKSNQEQQLEINQLKQENDYLKSRLDHIEALLEKNQ